MRCCSVARHLEAWPSASDLPRPPRTRKPCPRPAPPGRPSASHLPRLRRTRKSCPGAQVRATSRARAVRGSLVRARRLLVGHAQAASRARAVRESAARTRRHLVGHAQAASAAMGRGAREAQPFSNCNHQFGRGCPPQEYEQHGAWPSARGANTPCEQHGDWPSARRRNRKYPQSSLLQLDTMKSVFNRPKSAMMHAASRRALRAVIIYHKQSRFS